MKELHEWFQHPLGQAVIEEIQKQWESFEFSTSLNYGLSLQIGTSIPILPLKNLSVLTMNFLPGTEVIASMEELPFDCGSFSTVFLPFTLEYSGNISALLDEVNRILTPDGVVCIVGINPFSLWGMARIFHTKSTLPFRTNRYSSLRVYALLASRQFTTHNIKSFFYRPPCLSLTPLKKIRFLEPVGQMFWPYPGGLYFFLAQKVTPQFLPTEPLWQVE